MGSTVSIINESNVPINIALRQIGVLDWKNEVKPGETRVFKCGRVWFTVEATYDDPHHLFSRYTELDRALPIATVVIGTTALAGAAVAGAVAVLGASTATATTTASAAVGGTVAAETAGATVAGTATATAAGGSVAAEAAGAAGAAGAVAKTAAKLGSRATRAFALIQPLIGIGVGVADQVKMLKDNWDLLVRARMHGVYAGQAPKLIVKGNRDELRIEYLEREN